MQEKLCEWMVRRMLAGLRYGRLEVVGPDGRTVVYGGLGGGVRARMEVRSGNFWVRVVLFGAVGFGESYVAGEWETEDLAGLIAFFILNQEHTPALRKPGQRGSGGFNLLNTLNQLAHRRRVGTRRMARRNIREHYDLSNEFFRLWLDETMAYSCAYFREPGMSLADAQRAKFERMCRVLRLEPQDHVLEIGTGWGGWAIYAASHYGSRVTTVTISEEQHREASARVAAAGLAHRVTVLLCDYRDVRGRFDKVVSIEMVEAVGERHLDEFFAVCARALKPQGLLGMQMICCADRQYEVLRDGVDFIQKHIFPGSLLVSPRRVQEALYRTGELNLYDWKDMGPHYAETLKRWRENFEAKGQEVRALGFDEEFVRKWRYYLAYCEAGFGTRQITVAQAVWSAPRNGKLEDGPHPLWK